MAMPLAVAVLLLGPPAVGKSTLASRLGQAPDCVPPRRTRPKLVAPRELGGDLAVFHPQSSHTGTQIILLLAQAHPCRRHPHPLSSWSATHHYRRRLGLLVTMS